MSKQQEQNERTARKLEELIDAGYDEPTAPQWQQDMVRSLAFYLIALQRGLAN